MTSDYWKKLASNEALRVDCSGKYDFFWVRIEQNMPGLMLKLEFQPASSVRLPKFQNLIVRFQRTVDGWAFVIGLRERRQVELFETLCRDVVSAGESAKNLNDALHRAILRTNRWYHLLRGGRVEGLTLEEQRGLVGELAFLGELAKKLSPETALEAWKGPMGSPKDFEFMGCCVEVKTRRSAAKPFIAISSAEQLSVIDEMRLFLSVSNIESAITPKGMTLHEYVNTAAKLFENHGTIFSLWEEKIWATGYDASHEYEGRHWVLGNRTVYEVTKGFPRITNPLPNGISQVRYSIAIDACSPYEFEGDIFESIRKSLI